MKLTAIQAVSMAATAAVIAFPATAHAGGPPNPAPSPSPSPAPASAPTGQIQNSAGNVVCNLASTGVVCENDQAGYTVSGPPPACAQHSAWGDRFVLDQGGTVQLPCNNDTIRTQGDQIINNGQTLTAGTLSCTGEPNGMRCADSSTGHFFFTSTTSYQIG
jgi:hypothetical protein